MAIQVTRVRVCDVCGSGEGVQRYRVNYLETAKSLGFDLCDEHQSPLEALREAVGGKAKQARPKGQPVVSRQEVKASRARKSSR